MTEHRVAVLGAACTGKTTLVRQLVQALQAHGEPAHGQTTDLNDPRAGGTETAAGADGAAPVQTHQAPQAPLEWWLADVSFFGLGGSALAGVASGPAALTPGQHGQLARFDTLLLTGLDVGAEGSAAGRLARSQQDAWLRAALSHAGLRFQVIYGRGDLRWQQALAALGKPLPQHVDQRVPGQGRWLCERCSDPDCERRLFGRLLSRPQESAH